MSLNWGNNSWAYVSQEPVPTLLFRRGYLGAPKPKISPPLHNCIKLHFQFVSILKIWGPLPICYRFSSSPFTSQQPTTTDPTVSWDPCSSNYSNCFFPHSTGQEGSSMTELEANTRRRVENRREGKKAEAEIWPEEEGKENSHSPIVSGQPE